jgi:hypothetical protein
MSSAFRAAVSLALVHIVLGCSDPSAAPPDVSRASSDTRAGDLAGPFTFFPCVDTIFHATFASNLFFFPPGTPTVGSWTTNTAAGSVLVVPSSGGLLNKPVELRQTAGLPGGVDLFGKIECLFPPASGHARVYWRSMVRSPTAKLGIVVLRDNQAHVLGALAYRPLGVVTYNNIVVPGVTWSQNIPQLWLVEVDLTAHTTTLSLDNIPKLVDLPYVDAAASNLWQINMELGYTNAQIFAWDDIMIVRTIW